MSGSRDHGRDGQVNRPGLADKVKEEIRAALRLLFKDTDVHAVGLTVEAPLTTFYLEIPCEVLSPSLEGRRPEVSMDPVSALHRLAETQALHTRIDAVLAGGMGAICQPEAVVVSEAVFSDTRCSTHGVRFENVQWVPARCWAPIAVSRPGCRQWAVPHSSTRSGGLTLGRLKAHIGRLPTVLNRTASKTRPRFLALPIRKTPIPPHRFSRERREAFRQALAEKAGTRPTNIQLKLVYEHMDMSLYAGIQQEANGILLCTPRPEQAGRSGSAPGLYLVFGTRLDTGENCRALVPVEDAGHA